MAPPHRLLTVILTCAIVTTALQLPLTRRNIPSSLLAKRYTKDDTSLPDDPFNFRIFENVLYATTLHINGQPFQVSLVPLFMGFQWPAHTTLDQYGYRLQRPISWHDRGGLEWCNQYRSPRRSHLWVCIPRNWIEYTGWNITYVIRDFSRASGNLTLIDMTWGNFTVENQIFSMYILCDI